MSNLYDVVDLRLQGGLPGKLAELRDRGLSQQAIADLFEAEGICAVSHMTIKRWLLRAGIPTGRELPEEKAS